MEKIKTKSLGDLFAGELSLVAGNSRRPMEFSIELVSGLVGSGARIGIMHIHGKPMDLSKELLQGLVKNGRSEVRGQEILANEPIYFTAKKADDVKERISSFAQLHRLDLVILDCLDSLCMEGDVHDVSMAAAENDVHIVALTSLKSVKKLSNISDICQYKAFIECADQIFALDPSSTLYEWKRTKWQRFSESSYTS